MENGVSVDQIRNYHPITCALISKLKEGKCGDSYTYDDLKDIAGIDVKPLTKGYHYLQSARKYCITNNFALWEFVRSSNTLMCKNSKETIESVNCDIVSIRKKARKSVQKLQIIDTINLTDSDKRDVYAKQAQLGAISLFTKTSTSKRIKESTTSKTLEISETLKIFE